MKYLLKPALTVAVIALTLISLNGSAATLKQGDKAPDFEVSQISGAPFKLSDFTHDKPVYLKFWATWCSYCLAEMPHLQEIYDTYGDQIEIVTVNVGMNDSVANINRLFNKQGYSLPTIFDKKGELTSIFGVVGTPHHILIDRQGKIAYRTFLSSDSLDQQIRSLSNTQSNPDLAIGNRNKQ